MKAVITGRRVDEAAGTGPRWACGRRFETSARGARTSADGRAFARRVAGAAATATGAAWTTAGPLTGPSLCTGARFVSPPLRKATTPAENATTMTAPANAKATARRSTRQIDSAATRPAPAARAVCRARAPTAPTMSAALRRARWSCPPAAPKASLVPRHARRDSAPAAPKASVTLRLAAPTDGRSRARTARRGRWDWGSAPPNRATSRGGCGSSGGAAAKKLRSTSVQVASSEGFGRSPTKG